MTEQASKPEVLLLQRIADPGMERLEEHFNVVHLWDSPTPERAMHDHADTARGVLTGANIGLTPEQAERLTNLEIISLHGVGLDRVDIDHAQRKGLRIAYTPDVLTADVADMGFGLMMSTLRRLPQGHDFVKAGHWAQGKQPPLTRSLTSKRLGILGLGRIGQAIATRAEAFGMEIAYTNRTPREDVSYAFEPDLQRLAAWSDVLMVAAASSPGMRALVDDNVLAALGPDGIVVNVGRGVLVDESALIARLERGELLGAGLDVFADEPRINDALLTLDNVVLSAHRASATVETRNAMALQSVEHLIQHFSGAQPSHLATSEE
ncbi:2-hydroxyacid dehydrogenase [Aidingimonas lacisalsi]|uniref:2-hydroxyacid dehydrogenase n=1 Tax=Aidingimonas lacisalsi TaxID=2604086 RepID=UPI0011D25372|nr:2-hydroxyacid dehydrogenase [Aidingimonas lacisalsi]